MGKGGLDFMLAGDTEFHAQQRKLMGTYYGVELLLVFLKLGPHSISVTRLTLMLLQVPACTGISGSNRSRTSTNTSP